MFTLGAGKTLAASGPTAVNFFVFGDAVTTTDAFDILAKGSVSVAATTIYTATGVQGLVKTLVLFNTAGTPSTIFLYANGTATTDRFFTATIPAGGTLTYGQAGWQLTDATGATIVAAAPLTATGDATGTQIGSSIALTLASFGPGAVGPIGDASHVAAVSTDAKGRVSVLSSVLISIANTQVTGLGTLSTQSGTFSGTHSGSSSGTNTGDQSYTASGDATAPASASNLALTLATVNLTTGTFGSSVLIPVVTVNGKGLVTSVTTTSFNAGMTGWVDVTRFPGTPVLSGNTPAQNITAINAILAASGAGSTIYFPGQTFQFNAAWTMPAGKQFTFQGQGTGGTGGNTLLEWTANVAGDIISLPAGIWYWRFADLNFCVASGVTQSAGALINLKGAASTNFFNCTFSSIFGGFWNDVLFGDTPGVFPNNQSWNTAVIENCVLSGYKGRGIYIDSAFASLVVSNSVIQGQWGPTTGTPAAAMALAGIEAQNCGALQINDCDILGNINNLLLDPAVSKVCASVFCTTTYFDSSGGSCIKISGAGATVRARFDTCSFTTAGTNFTTVGTNLSAVEIGGSFVFGAGGQGIDFVNCNVLNTFGTTGTATGFLITNAADFSVGNSRVAGWPGNGFSITPMASNKTFPQLTNNTIGPAGGYGANGTGINIAAGAYKGLVIQNNAVINNTNFNLTQGAVTTLSAAEAGFYRITDNAGINPKGTVTTPAVPATTVVATNTTGFRVTAYIKGGTITVVTVNGVVTGQAAGAGATLTFPVAIDPGGTIAMTFTVAPTWVWIAN